MEQTFTERVGQMTREELDDFFAHCDLDPEADWRHPAHCVPFTTDRIATKNRLTGEKTPMFLLGSNYFSAQRISIILFGCEDPHKKKRIVTKCDKWDCVNPEHLLVE